MLGLAHVLVSEGLHDTAFLEPLHRRRRPSHRATSSARATAWPRRPSGRRPSPASPRTTCAPSPAAWRRAARWSPSAGPCSAPSTASSRCGWASPSPPCSARSVCPAAASATATARWPTSARPRCPYPLPVLAAGPQPGGHLHPGRPDHRAARATPAARSSSTDARLPLPGHPPRVLGGRQPVPPPPGPEPAAPGLRPSRHRHRPRAVLDGHRPPRRHRAADDDERSSGTTSVPAATTAT